MRARPRVGRQVGHRRVLVWLMLLAIVTAACSPSDEAGLTVFAAASLRSVVEDLETAWLAEYPDVPLTLSSEASNVLAAQIAEGAGADVFLSADTERPRQLAEAGLTADEPRAFARNRVALVVREGSGQLASALDVAKPGVRLVGANDAAPIARYAREAIAALAATTAQPETFVAAVEDNLVSREDNVSAALAKVELGEGDAAFVYRTDAIRSEAVRTVPLPSSAAVRADYDAVQVSDAPYAAEFVAWLAGPTAGAIIEAAGFEVAT